MNHPTGEEYEIQLRHLQEAVEADPHHPSLHYNLGLLLWEKGIPCREQAAEHFVTAAKLNPHNGEAFRYLGHYYSKIDGQRAIKCYQRAVSLNPEDSHSGEALCDLLDSGGKESLEVAVCREASGRSPRAFWAFRRLGYMLVHQKKWSDAVQSLQQAIRGYPACPDIWEALGLAYQRLGKYTAAIKSYGRAMELEDARVFPMIETGNIFLMLGSYRKGVEQFRHALEVCPQNLSVQYGLASALLALSKECINLGAFVWVASLLEEAFEITKSTTALAGNISTIWKLQGDIQLTFAKSFPWMERGNNIENDKEAFTTSLNSWRKTRELAAIRSCCSYQRALHLAPWQANIYTDIAVAADLIFCIKQIYEADLCSWRSPEKMALGSLLLEGDCHEFWVVLGCLSSDKALKQHAFIRGMQLDVSLAVAWSYLGKLYGEEGKNQLGRQAFDRARSIDPSLALPWAGMSADIHAREPVSDEAYESCLRAVQILPLAEFQIGLAKLALLSGHFLLPQVLGAIQQAVQCAPYYPESHNLNGLISEARADYQSAVASYKLARHAVRSAFALQQSSLTAVSVNLARALCRAGNAWNAVQELEELKRGGLLDVEGLQVYAMSLWQLGKSDLALSAARDLATQVSILPQSSAAASICLICRLLYSISGVESAINRILKLPEEMFQSAKVSFVVSAIHAIDQSNHLHRVVSSSRQSLSSHEQIIKMHLLIAMSKLVKHGSGRLLEVQTGVDHLRKALHMYPNSSPLRNMLGYLLLYSKRWEDTHVSNRCYAVGPLDCQSNEGLRCAHEVFGAEAVACHAAASHQSKYSFSTCKYQSKQGASAVALMQRWLHQEPWNHNARYLLVLTLQQKARELRYPQHLIAVLRRMIYTALEYPLYSEKRTFYDYKRFQLLLCSSENSLQDGDFVRCLSQAKDASEFSLVDGCIFFTYLQFCRAHAAQNDDKNLQQEYLRCLKLQVDHPIAWLSLKFIESHYKLQIDSNTSDEKFVDCLNKSKGAWNAWMAIYKLVCGLNSIWLQDLSHAGELLAEACCLESADCCLFLCHGAICLELARRECDPKCLISAIRSLRKAQQMSALPLPFVSLLLAQTEASLGSKMKWEECLRHEWFSWFPEIRPAELYFQMHLLASQLREREEPSLSGPEQCQSPWKWVIRAIHLNPSCARYWRILWKLLSE